MNETTKLWPTVRAGEPVKVRAGSGVAARLLYANVPRAAVYLYAGVLILLYIFVSVHTPLNVMANGRHDDGLFIALGRYLSEGRWLGPFNQFTLMKGPGYPMFLAVSNWLGTPISLSHALLHCAAVTFFAVVAHRYIRSILLSGLLFTLLLWHPVTLSEPLLRVLRDRIYLDELLIVLAAFALALLNGIEWRRRLLWGAFGGAVLGWFWLTREEGIWVLPGLGVMVLAAALRAFRSHQLRQLAGAVVTIVAVFAVTQAGFRAVNWWAYGKFVGVDFKEANFQRALRALSSVRSGGTKPFVSMTHATMQHVYAASPTFASLAPSFEGPERAWERFGCIYYPSTCGEISAGWFIWALRSAAERGGHYSSPSEASAFFGKLADEVEAACARGALDCKPQLIAEMSPMTWQRLADGLRTYDGDALRLLFLLDFSVPGEGTRGAPRRSSGDKQLLSDALRFLNYPLHSRSHDISLRFTTYTIKGWYYRSGAEWVSVAVMRRNGTAADVRFDRGDSPDIAAHFNDERASMQRYVIDVECNEECVLQVRSPEGGELNVKFAELIRKAHSGFPVGSGTFFIDSVNPVADPAYQPTPADVLAARIRAAVFSLYKFLFMPVLVLGALAFAAASVAHWRNALGNPCYVMALATWILALARAGLLLLATATSLPALLVHYMAPAYVMLVCAAVFSFAAWLQLSGTPKPGSHSASAKAAT